MPEKKLAAHPAGMTKRATAHTLRTAFAHRLKEAGYQLDDIQKLLGHADVKTTMIYTCILSVVEGHVLNRGGLAARRGQPPRLKIKPGFSRNPVINPATRR